MSPSKLISILILSTSFSSAKSNELLLERQDFRECETQAIAALDISRSAMHLKNPKQSVLNAKSNREFQIAAINEVYDEIARFGSKDHADFAARKFFECTKRAGLPIKVDLYAAKFCLARQDILFYLSIDRENGLSEREAGERIRQRFSNSSKSVYSDAIIERLVPIVFSVVDNEDEYRLRRYVFETCYLPDDWRVWDKSVQSRKAMIQ